MFRVEMAGETGIALCLALWLLAVVCVKEYIHCVILVINWLYTSIFLSTKEADDSLPTIIFWWSILYGRSPSIELALQCI